MKTTFDLPGELVTRGKIAAARRRTSLKKLVVEGLEAVLRESDESGTVPGGALHRLLRGYHLGGKPLTRDEAHAP